MATNLSTVKEVSDSDAFFSSNTSSYTNIGELLVNANSATGTEPFRYDTFKALLDKIPNSGTGDNLVTRIANLKTSLNENSSATEPNAITSADLRANNSDKSVVVRLGGLDWIVTFISNDQTNQNVIATLWLSNNHQIKWGWDGTGGTTATAEDVLHNATNYSSGAEYTACSFVNGGLYSKWGLVADLGYDISGADGVYGKSYVRVEALNNPSIRSYDKEVSQDTRGIVDGSTQSTSHPFALYTMSQFGLINTTDASKSYLATPNQMKWINNIQNPANGNNSSNWYSNESLATDASTGNSYGYTGSWGTNLTSETRYTSWATDYLWLPSLSEIGAGVKDSVDYDGLWEISEAERSTYDGSTSGFSSENLTADYYTGVWTRSASSKKVYAEVVGTETKAIGRVTYMHAVRPCMLLNLTKVVGSLNAAVIRLDKQGGTGGEVSTAALKGTTLSNLTAVPTRTGMIFGGYYTQANGGGTKIYNADGTPAVISSPFESDTTLYAYWKPYFDVEMTGATFTFKQVFDAEMINATLKITPQTGYRVSEISFDNTNWTDVEYCNFSFGNTAFAMNITYFANEQSNVFALDFRVILHDFDTAGSIPIYLKTASGAYSGLKNSGSVSGVVVTATLGGMAYIVGDDFENLGDNDTITVSTKLCQSGYTFVGWYLDDDRTTAISTATSYRVAKSVAFEHTLVAVYQPTSNNNVNLETDNTE